MKKLFISQPMKDKTNDAIEKLSGGITCGLMIISTEMSFITMAV